MTHKAAATLCGTAIAAVLLAAGVLGPPPAAAQQRRVVVVGDSVILGAKAPITSSLAGQGWAVTFDAAVSRSTAAGLAAIGCTVEPIADGLRLTARLTLPAQGARETVAFETGDPAVWVAEAVSQRQGGELVAMTELVAPSGQPFSLDRSAVTVTVISEAGAVEVQGCPAP